MPVSRRQIVRSCKARGWQIQPDALKGIEAYGHSHEDLDFLDNLAEYMADSASKTLTNAIWQEYLKDQESFLTSSKPSSAAATLSSSDVRVISAFQDVRLVYHTMKKHFLVEQQPWSLFGKAEDKVRACLKYIHWLACHCSMSSFFFYFLLSHPYFTS